ncbi:hypothetical protein MXD95_018530 [Frankia sp. AiPa1]|nr:hypothetical protein [Frankia sp. AiPa1]
MPGPRAGVWPRLRQIALDAHGGVDWSSRIVVAESLTLTEPGGSRTRVHRRVTS